MPEWRNLGRHGDASTVQFSHFGMVWWETTKIVFKKGGSRQMETRMHAVHWPYF